jgi:hypothetical protein
MKTLLMILALIVLINDNLYSQWVQTPGIPAGAGVTDMVIASNGAIIVSCGSFNFPSGPQGGVRISTNKGVDWRNGFDAFTARTVTKGQQNNIFASAWNYPVTTEGLYRSSNNGENWTGLLFTIGANNNIFSILALNNNQTIFIGTRTGVLKSTNAGFNFVPASTGIPSNSWVYELAADTNGVIAAATTGGLFISTNSGGIWNQSTGFNSTDTVSSVFFGGTSPGISLFAGTTNGKLAVFPNSLLYNSASSVTIIDPNLRIEDIDSAFWGTSLQSILAAGTPRNPSQSGSGVYKSANGGLNWAQISGGLPTNPVVSSIASDTIDIYVSTYKNTSLGAEVFFRPLNTIGIQQISAEIPVNFSLSQNYPNPFNPETKIKFTISANVKAKNIQLEVYNAIGRKIALLVNESLAAGVYEYKFDASDLSNGIYFYSLSVGDFKETKKMMLVK